MMRKSFFTQFCSAFIEQTEIRHRVQQQRKIRKLNGASSSSNPAQMAARHANSVLLAALEQEERRERERIRMWRGAGYVRFYYYTTTSSTCVAACCVVLFSSNLMYIHNYT